MKKRLVLKKEVKEEIIDNLLDLGFIGTFIFFCYVMFLFF